MTRKSTRKTSSRRRTTLSRRKSKSRQKPALQVGQLLENLRRSFGPRQKEVLAILLLVGALLTLLGLTSVTTGSLVDAWVGFLEQVFGLGAYLLAVMLAVLGVWLLLRSVNQVSPLKWRVVVGLQISFLVAMALLHRFLGGDDILGLAQRGEGGGHLGWAILDLLQRTLGDLIGILLLLAGLFFGLALTFDWTLEDLTSIFLSLTDRLRQALPEPEEAVGAERATPRRRKPAARSRVAASPPPVVEQSKKAASKREVTPLPPARVIGGESAPPLPQTRRRAVRLPQLDLLISDKESGYDDADVRERAQIIERTLASFDVPVRVKDKPNVGPVVTQFELEPLYTEHRTASGEIRKRKVRVSKISALSNDLALALAASPIRIEAPVPGRSVVGVEVPNSQVALVGLRDVMDSETYRKKRSRLKIALGRGVSGEPVVADLATMPHLLIAGATGSGKSVCINAVVTCLAFNNRPQDLRMAMIDPKMVELSRFNGLPHLLGPVEIELDRIGGVLHWATQEMDERYKKFASAGARNLGDYNAKVKAQEHMPRIVIFIDELADMMMSAPDETERTITRLAQMARATGMHLVVATQRPSVDVVTGLIKANFPTRVSFAVTSQVDSRVILDQPGAETLLGKGDMLYMASDAAKLVRLQGCFVSDVEITNLLSYWNDQVPKTERDEKVLWDGAVTSTTQDPLMEKAVDLVRQTGSASASFLQRRMRIGYPRASRIIDQMEEMGIIGPPETGGRRRKVLLEAAGEMPPELSDQTKDE